MGQSVKSTIKDLVKSMFWFLDIRNCILPFDVAQGGESFDSAQDRETVQRFVEAFDIC